MEYVLNKFRASPWIHIAQIVIKERSNRYEYVFFENEPISKTSD